LTTCGPPTRAGADSASAAPRSRRGAAAVAAHLAQGNRAESARLASEQLALARAATIPLALGAALRAYASVAADPLEPLEEAIAILEPLGARYDLALALADLGACLRRAGRVAAARDPLRRALDLADRTGAALVSEYARRELAAVGVRPRRAALTGPDALTSAERQVADLAAVGRSNKQIAQHLFISTGTVETHLRHVFQKLDVSSRTAIPAELAAVRLVRHAQHRLDDVTGVGRLERVVHLLERERLDQPVVREPALLVQLDEGVD
jgi:DNA-binding CsgD family transcriptional regulator